MKSKRQVICLTPIKNEEWILERFLRAASLWADHIIIADQGSTDRSAEICSQFSKVHYVVNDSVKYDELYRQNLLISEARKIDKQAVLIALDADEFLSADSWNTDEWNKMCSSLPGTIIKFPWPSIDPELKKYWLTSSTSLPFGLVDNGQNHHGTLIHNNRLPFTEANEIMEVTQFVVMHFQFIDWKRMVSKQRWYQCFERITYPNKSVIDIFRRYNHMYSKTIKKELIPVSWMANYNQLGIDLKKNNLGTDYYWDNQIIELIDKHGVDKFKHIDLDESNSYLLSYLRLTRRLKLRIIDKIIKIITGL